MTIVYHSGPYPEIEEIEYYPDGKVKRVKFRKLVDCVSPYIYPHQRPWNWFGPKYDYRFLGSD